MKCVPNLRNHRVAYYGYTVGAIYSFIKELTAIILHPAEALALVQAATFNSASMGSNVPGEHPSERLAGLNSLTLVWESH